MRRTVPLLLAAVLAVGCADDAGTPDSAPASSPPVASPSPTAPSATTASPAPAPPAGSTPARDRRLDRPLIRAARRGDVDRVRSLLARGASVRARDRTGATALVAAAYGNHVDVAAQLVGAGADVNRKDRTRQSAYLIATSEVGDDPRLLQLTLSAGADVRSLDRFDGTGLIRAAERGNVDIVRRLLATDIRIDHVNNLGWTALHEAVILGDGGRRYVRTVRLLVRAGADVNKPSRHDGVRPLQHAERRGYGRIAAVLRAAGAR